MWKDETHAHSQNCKIRFPTTPEKYILLFSIVYHCTVAKIRLFMQLHLQSRTDNMRLEKYLRNVVSAS